MLWYEVIFLPWTGRAVGQAVAAGPGAERKGNDAMPVTCVTENRVMRLRVSGEIDHHQARALMEEIDRYVESGLPRQLTLDLEGVTFMDSSGLALLLRAQRRMQELQGELRVAHVPAQADKVLKAAGLYRILKIDREE